MKKVSQVINCICKGERRSCPQVLEVTIIAFRGSDLKKLKSLSTAPKRNRR
jgi:hypothetical protein